MPGIVTSQEDEPSALRYSWMAIVPVQVDLAQPFLAEPPQILHRLGHGMRFAHHFGARVHLFDLQCIALKRAVQRCRHRGDPFGRLVDLVGGTHTGNGADAGDLRRQSSHKTLLGPGRCV